MMLFNSGIIFHLIHYRHEVINQNLQLRHRSTTLTLVITTFLCLIMTVPATIPFALLSTSDSTILLDSSHIIYFIGMLFLKKILNLLLSFSQSKYDSNNMLYLIYGY